MESQPKALPFSFTQTGGQASVIIKAPADCVWHELKDFFDLTWWDPKFNIVKLSDNVRIVQTRHAVPTPGTIDTDTTEELVNFVEKDGFYEQVYVKKDFNVVTNTEKSEVVVKFETAMKNVIIKTTIRVENTAGVSEGIPFTKFTFFSTMTGPINLVRLLGDYQTAKIYEDAALRLEQSFEPCDLTSPPIQAVQKSLSDLGEYLIASLRPGENEVIGFDTYNVKTTLPFTLKKALKFTEFNDTLEQEKICKIFECVNKLGLDQLKFFLPNSLTEKDPFLAYFATDKYEEAVKKGLTPNKQLSSVRPTKDIVQNWQTDEFFGHAVFNGSNPLSVKRVTSLDLLKPELRDIKIKGKSLEHYVQRMRLYFLDNKQLEPYQYPRQHRGMHVHAPQVLLYRNSKGHKILPVAIYFTDGQHTRVVTPHDGLPNTWLLAKIHAMCADMQIFQFIYHLGNAHLATEPFVVALHNTITIKGKDHFLARMLRPHFKNMLGINHFARISLISEIAPLTDQTFSIGTVPALDLFATHYETEYSFLDLAPDRDLIKRGFALDDNDDGVTYFYREDGVRLFNLMLDYAKNVLTTVYSSEADFKKDEKVQAFLSYCHKEVTIKGFPENVNSIEEMARIIATLIWVLTAYHNLSFAIENLDCYIPFRPACVQKPFPITGVEDVPLSYITSTLPYPKKCLLILLLNNIVTLRTMPTLLNIVNVFANDAKLEPVFEEFRGNLKKLSESVQKRNELLKSQGKRYYTYLDPAVIEGSLSI